MGLYCRNQRVITTSGVSRGPPTPGPVAARCAGAVCGTQTGVRGGAPATAFRLRRRSRVHRETAGTQWSSRRTRGASWRRLVRRWVRRAPTGDTIAVYARAPVESHPFCTQNLGAARRPRRTMVDRGRPKASPSRPRTSRECDRADIWPCGILAQPVPRSPRLNHGDDLSGIYPNENGPNNGGRCKRGGRDSNPQPPHRHALMVLRGPPRAAPERRFLTRREG